MHEVHIPHGHTGYFVRMGTITVKQEEESDGRIIVKE